METLSVVRQRDQCILKRIKEVGGESIRELANAIGVSIGKVQRGLKAITRRNRYPESSFWETPEGYEWLVRMILAVLYEFGIKGGQGADRISSFLKRIHVEEQVGVSPTSLSKLLHEMESLMSEYQKLQESQDLNPQEVVGSGDETFDGDRILLVMLDLISGYIFVEEEAEDRSYETWMERVKARLDPLKIQVRHFISDRGKSLIKLALSGLKCAAGADLFHAQYDLSKWVGFGFFRKTEQTNKQVKKAQEVVEILTLQAAPEAEVLEKKRLLDQALSEQRKLEEGKQRYHQLQQEVSVSLHAFVAKTSVAQTSPQAQERLEELNGHLSQLAQTHEISDSKGISKKFSKQISDLCSILDVWWLWTKESLEGKGLDEKTREGLLYGLLPVVYWDHQRQKTQNPSMRDVYYNAWTTAMSHWQNHPLSQALAPQDQLEHLSWADWICSKFHRASSAVEGRNGDLSQMIHNGRGLSSTRLKALTVISNFDSRRDDGTTAAERLFGRSFPDLFTWLVEQMGDLPLPRKSQKRVFPNPLNSQSVSA